MEFELKKSSSRLIFRYEFSIPCPDIWGILLKNDELGRYDSYDAGVNSNMEGNGDEGSD